METLTLTFSSADWSRIAHAVGTVAKKLEEEGGFAERLGGTSANTLLQAAREYRALAATINGARQ